MRDIKKLFFLSILAWLSVLVSLTLPVYADDNNSEILVIGSADIIRDNLAEARKLALSDAHRKGIEEYLVRTLGGQGMINYFENIINEIIPGSDDVIENYDIRAEDRNSRSCKLLVSIKVNEKLMEERLRNSGIILYEGESLRILFLISDRTSPDEMPFVWWDDPENKTNLSSSELILIRLFQERGFDPVNRLTGVPEGGYNPELFRDELTYEDAAQWGKLYSADVVILGKVDVSEFNILTVDLNAVKSDDSALISSYSHEQILESDPETAVTVAEVQEKIITDGVAQIIPDILKAFKKEEEKLTSFSMELKGFDSLRQLTAFISFIREKISGVSSAVQTGITNGAITMTVEFFGSKNAFIEKIKSSTEAPFAADIVIDENGTLTVTPM